MGLTQKLGTIPLAIQTDSSNNIGIGGAANASYKLAVTGASLFTGAGTFNNAVSLVSSAPTLNLSSTSATGINEIYFNRNTSSLIGYMAVGVNSTITGSGDEFIIDNRASGGGLIFRTNNAGTSAARMTITGAGNVGIGTTSPSERLHIVGDAFAGIRINDGTNTALLQWHVSDGFRMVTTTAKPLVFFTNDTERMRLTSAGNLQVQGQVYRYSGQTVVGGGFTNLTSIDMSSSRTYLIQMIATNVEATLGYRIFGVLQGNATSSTYTFVSLASQTMEVQFSGTTVQARVTNGQQWTFNWTITQLL